MSPQVYRLTIRPTRSTVGPEATMRRACRLLDEVIKWWLLCSPHSKQPPVFRHKLLVSDFKSQQSRKLSPSAPLCKHTGPHRASRHFHLRLGFCCSGGTFDSRDNRNLWKPPALTEQCVCLCRHCNQRNLKHLEYYRVKQRRQTASTNWTHVVMWELFHEEKLNKVKQTHCKH